MFYHYRQNNSGGDFVVNDNVTYNVIIEANNAKQANAIAEAVGLYFHGFGDCPCCGNRWSEAWEDEEGDSTPMIYDTPAQEFKETWAELGEPSVYIYYADDRKETYYKGH